MEGTGILNEKAKVGRIRHPRIVCYRSLEDLKVLKRWFYDFDKEDRRARAIQRVKALSSRGRVPHAIESTSMLTAVHLSDSEIGGSERAVNSPSTDASVVQMAYTMSLIRFVNGFLDPFQQSNYAIPLHHLAKNLELPGFFVEIRHMGTHEQLPSMNMLRIACKEALNWLYDHYWAKIESDAEDDDGIDLLEEHSENEIARIKDSIVRAKDLLRVLSPAFKELLQIRKQNPNEVYRFGDTSEEGTRYWKCVKTFKKLLTKDETICVDALIFQCILGDRSRDKRKKRSDAPPRVEANIRLLQPLLDEMGDVFKTSLILSAIKHVEIYQKATLSSEEAIQHKINQNLNFRPKYEDDIDQIIEIIAVLAVGVIMSHYNVSNKTSKKNSDKGFRILTDILDKIEVLSTEGKYRCYQSIHLAIKDKPIKLDPSVSKRISGVVAEAQKQLKLNEFLPPPSLENLLGISSSDKEGPASEKEYIQRKKRKISSDHDGSYKHYFFEKHEEWSPKPFGVPI